MTLKEYEWKTDPDFLETTIPLEIGTARDTPHKYHFILVDAFRGEEKIDVFDYIAPCKRFEDELYIKVISGGVRKNLEKWELINDGVMIFIHEEAVEKMNKICPDDFQAVPARVVPSSKVKEEFCIKDYYALHFLHEIDAVDLESCEFSERGQKKFEDYCTSKITREELNIGPHSFRVTDIEKIAYFDDKWDGHYLAKDKLTRKKLWHPRLVQEFAKTYGIFFYAADWRKRPAWMLRITGYS